MNAGYDDIGADLLWDDSEVAMDLSDEDSGNISGDQHTIGLCKAFEMFGESNDNKLEDQHATHSGSDEIIEEECRYDLRLSSTLPAGVSHQLLLRTEAAIAAIENLCLSFLRQLAYEPKIEIKLADRKKIAPDRYMHCGLT